MAAFKKSQQYFYFLSLFFFFMRIGYISYTIYWLNIKKEIILLKIIIALLLTTSLFASSNFRIKTVHGDIVVKLLEKKAPNTVKRIKELIKSKFYNGLKFHRVIKDFVVQGGDPKGNGTGGSGTKLKAEFNDEKHVLGTVAMARSQNINSADSQFYISLGVHPHLDNKYTVFGKVTKGIEVVKKVKQNDKMILVTLE